MPEQDLIAPSYHIRIEITRLDHKSGDARSEVWAAGHPTQQARRDSKKDNLTLSLDKRLKKGVEVIQKRAKNSGGRQPGLSESIGMAYLAREAERALYTACNYPKEITLLNQIPPRACEFFVDSVKQHTGRAEAQLYVATPAGRRFLSTSSGSGHGEALHRMLTIDSSIIDQMRAEANQREALAILDARALKKG